MPKSLASFLANSGLAVLVEIEAVKGSSPRETGTFMLVSATSLWETIGGGQFEYMAIDHARAMLEGKTSIETLDIPLGPEIGQCCGGRILLRFTKVTQAVADALSARLKQAEEHQPAVFIFGAGHVGKALAQALSLLPLSISVIETRRAELDGLPEGVAVQLTAMPEAMVKGIPPGGAAIIVTHDHALDFLIAKEALSRHDLSYIGMIGSKTKRATFASWLAREGGTTNLEHLTLPIGGNLVKDKRPAVIAALVAAEVLHAMHRCDAPAPALSRPAHP
ncbi:xanthine dehydrogenase accessory protein XdhC [Agrobacterium larrymoorei]|uniref:xanthine dehydrogenase accessory protein XdhC n=1 Tax=Agrobacterium larrymoorei TaxID=160699 RepID=UPI001574895B|nr:xanthine dehydrogenase accessory protein XdhC [Agrobacterium larrymoorei]NTJ43037.1 xanthine dehydrogenase accessory protein XdhC [Agrobacterium larrymoorei]